MRQNADEARYVHGGHGWRSIGWPVTSGRSSFVVAPTGQPLPHCRDTIGLTFSVFSPGRTARDSALPRRTDRAHPRAFVKRCFVGASSAPLSMTHVLHGYIDVVLFLRLSGFASKLRAADEPTLKELYDSHDDDVEDPSRRDSSFYT